MGRSGPKPVDQLNGSVWPETRDWDTERMDPEDMEPVWAAMNRTETENQLELG